ncbi:hypothetical protein BDE36_3161 [Arcticibacter tournemirensis]|uniref:Porin family protein n=1 Tax=Arcticibacter tournemirensis TaxID=699437 RepID=A0A5M9HEF0_9SPHI|nr:hypothetical protein [Arcticibacter tournemirensis]KAA8483658.1 hypothetical protein F1649_08795 [Arcticibacter tournemirensis]TQM51383.1 hypothetical protein BDE36_3161 [Arcticibacter tournemirensis]
MRIKYFLEKRSVAACIILLATAVFTSFGSFAQEHSEATEESEKGAHKFTLSIGHAHVHEGIENGEKKWLVMGAWGFNYDYLINSKWSIGLHNDLILEDFTVEKQSGEEEEIAIERERPLATKIIGAYKLDKHLSIMLGAGDEIAKGENYFLSTIGAEYGLHIPGGWEFGAELAYDVKWKAYDTWILGFGISKVISGHHHKHHKS